MATVALYFQPFVGDDAISLRIEESVDQSVWTEIEVVTEVGTYPDWISSAVTDAASSIERWFRIRWEMDTGQFTAYSPPIWGADIPPRWTVPAAYRVWTRLDTSALNEVQIQSLIDRAYFRLLEECGPYDLANPEFAERAQLAIHLLVDRLLLVSDPEAQKVLSGYLEEQKGSYRYRRSDRAIDLLLSASDEIPSEITSLVCPFSLEPTEDTLMATTHVFGQAGAYTESSGITEYVYTGEDRWEFTPDVWGVYVPRAWGTL